MYQTGWCGDDNALEIPEIPEVANGKVFCSCCFGDARLLMCPQCGKDDALAVNGSQDGERCWTDARGTPCFTLAPSHSCSRCSRPAVATESWNGMRHRVASDLSSGAGERGFLDSRWKRRRIERQVERIVASRAIWILALASWLWPLGSYFFILFHQKSLKSNKNTLGRGGEGNGGREVGGG